MYYIKLTQQKVLLTYVSIYANFFTISFSETAFP